MLDKSRIALACIVGMFFGFLISRALLSVSMFLFGINAIRDVPPRQWLKQKWWLLGVAWVAVYALSGLWSDNKEIWGESLQTKLPFLLLPLAFSYQPKFSPRQIQFFTLTMALMMICAACYTIGIFFTNPTFYISEYKVSHMLPTLPKKDHIRSSMASALTIIWCVYAWPNLSSKRVKVIVGACIALVVVYIHMLAAKTGLLSLYLFIVVWGVYLSFGKKKLLGIVMLVAIPITVLLALRMIPTLRERATFIGYTIFMYKHTDKSENLGDVARLISYKISGGLIMDHPLIGVGVGDMKGEMDARYLKDYPGIDEHGRLIPHNQFLVVGLGCGIPTMILFLWWVFWPLSRMRRNRASFFFFAVWLILLILLMIEPALEVQFGVFVYLFFLLLHLQELGDPKDRVAGATTDVQPAAE
jgi:O-antigen ligase